MVIIEGEKEERKKGRKKEGRSVIIIPVKYNKRCKAVPFVGLLSCVP